MSDINFTKGEARKVGKPRQIKIPENVKEKVVYLPKSIPELRLNVSKSDMVLSEECEMKIKQMKGEALALCCIKDHTCSELASLKIMIRERGPVPSDNASAFHLRYYCLLLILMIIKLNIGFGNVFL